jgi:predicted secreted Zn-dependent protease
MALTAILPPLITHQPQVSEPNIRMHMSDLLSTDFPATDAAPQPQPMFCAVISGFLLCAFRRPVAGRILAVAALFAAMHAPETARAMELASLKFTVVHPAQRWSSAPLVRETYDTYNVNGTSIPELRAGLHRNGVRMNNGDIYDALTSWDVKWEYDYDRSHGGCSVDDFRAVVDVTIRYPRWVSNDDAPAPLADAWGAYLHSLIQHEQGHRDIAVAAADGLIRAATALPPAATCADLDRAVEVLGQSFMKRLTLDQQTYDAETSHGAMQGAVLP